MTSIDLRSDTLTKLQPSDLHGINYNHIGDDCYEEDYYVKELESYIANLFNKESALFMPSGTMSNQIGLKVLSQPGDEVISEVGYHLCFFESSQTAALNGLVINNVKSKNGILTEKDVNNAIDNKARWSNFYSTPRIISIESSIGSYGGIVFPLSEIQKLKMLCCKKNIFLFLDGARVLNACISIDISPKDYVADIDMLNIFLLSTGFDLVHCYLSLFVKNIAYKPEIKCKKQFSSIRFLISDKPGTIIKIHPHFTLNKPVLYKFVPTPVDVDRLQDSYGRLGYVITTAETPELATKTAEDSINHIEITYR